MQSKLTDATKIKTNILFPTSAQTASNVGTFLCCINCCQLRLLYVMKKVQASELNTLKRVFNGFQFIYGTSLQLKNLMYVMSHSFFSTCSGQSRQVRSAT